MNFLLFGRPNVGKSSIYNILTGQKKNIIHIEEGTTRDWHKSKIRGLNHSLIYDSPGVIIKYNKSNEIHNETNEIKPRYKLTYKWIINEVQI